MPCPQQCMRLYADDILSGILGALVVVLQCCGTSVESSCNIWGVSAVVCRSGYADEVHYLQKLLSTSFTELVESSSSMQMKASLFTSVVMVIEIGTATVLFWQQNREQPKPQC